MSDTYQTNGLVDLIGRRAIWGTEKVRIEGVVLAEDGAYAKIVLIKNGKTKEIRVERLNLVPLEHMPAMYGWDSPAAAGAGAREGAKSASL